MVKLVTTCALLCAFFITESTQADSVQLIFSDNSFIFTSNDDLCVVQLTNTSLDVSSLKYKLSCSIAINSTTDFTIDGFQAKALTSGRKFVIWGTNSWGVQLHRRGYETKFMVLLVDPWSCEYKSLQLPVYETETKYPYGDIVVVTYKDSFDVFLPGQKYCSPCRFDKDGNKVELEYQLEFSRPELTPKMLLRVVHIQPLNPKELKQGYFFARNFANNTAVIEHLDERFKILKRLNVDHPVHAVAMKPGLPLSICYILHNFHPVLRSEYFEVHCQQLDSNFEPKLTIGIVIPEKNFVSGIQDIIHHRDRFGNMYVGFIESSNESTLEDNDDQYRQIRFLVYDKNGKMLESKYFHTSDTDERIVKHFNGLHSYLLTDDSICLLTYRFREDTMKTFKVIRCYDISKYAFEDKRF